MTYIIIKITDNPLIAVIDKVSSIDATPEEKKLSKMLIDLLRQIKNEVED